MALLLWSFVVVEGKTRRSGENSGRACSDRGGSVRTRLGIAERALNEPRNLRHLKINIKNNNKK
jgi:hypothetical protein